MFNFIEARTPFCSKQLFNSAFHQKGLVLDRNLSNERFHTYTSNVQQLSIPSDASGIYSDDDNSVIVIISRCKRYVFHYVKNSDNWALKVYLGLSKRVQDIANAIYSQERLSVVFTERE